MVKKKSVFEMKVTESSADLFIYGDITADADLWNWWFETDSFVSSNNLVKTIQDLDVKDINVYINSYGGEVAEALAIYSALKRHEAKVHTFCDGFACSAATIIFCAGDDRVMGDLALMMIHNASMYLGSATAEDMRKAAEDIDKITQASVKAYLAVSNLSEEEIHRMMDRETWISADEALQWGFATEITEPEEEEDPQQSTFRMIREAILHPQSEAAESDPVEERLTTMEESLKEIKEALTPVQILKPVESDPELMKVKEKVSKCFSFLN